MDKAIIFKSRIYKKYNNRISKFLSLVGDKHYAIVGSGDCAEKIMQVLEDNHYVLPQGIYDDRNFDKKINGIKVEPISDMKTSVEFVLTASQNFAEQIKQKIHDHLGERTGQLNIASFMDFSEYRSKKVSRQPIIINTLPKTGTAFIRYTLEKNLGIDSDVIAEGDWPATILSRGTLQHCLKSCAFSVSHLSADKRTVGLLKHYQIEKVAVNIRDPRQAMLSWLHHLDRTQHSIFLPASFFRCNDYFGMDFEAKINYQINHYLPEACKFISDWISVDESGDIDVLFLNFSEMKNAPASFFGKIYDYFEVDAKLGDIAPPKKGEGNFRKGMEDEWKSVFTPSQIEAANRMIPTELKARFGWVD